MHFRAVVGQESQVRNAADAEARGNRGLLIGIDVNENEVLRFGFEAPNPPIYAGDANLFTRLSFESIKARFEAWGYSVDHIIRGACSESGVRDCYVYNRSNRIPFAVIRPLV